VPIGDQVIQLPGLTHRSSNKRSMLSRIDMKSRSGLKRV
jgi:hypothetical protein